MLTMAIPDVEMLAVRLFTVCFNVFARWHQRPWFKRSGVWGDMVVVRVESSKIVFLWDPITIDLFRHLCCMM